MSYFNCLINPYQFSQATSLQYQSSTILEQQATIKMLSIALKNSLISYQQTLLPSNPPPPTLTDSQIIRKNEGLAQKKNVIQILSSDQEQTIRKQLKISQKGLIREEKQARATPAPKSQEQSPTSEELPLEEEHQRTAGKGKAIKKGKIEKKVEYHIIVPEIDMIETCHPPQLGLKRQEKCKIRQALLRRQVFVWVSKVKKQKREVRMLDH